MQEESWLPLRLKIQEALLSFDQRTSWVTSGTSASSIPPSKLVPALSSDLYFLFCCSRGKCGPSPSVWDQASAWDMPIVKMTSTRNNLQYLEFEFSRKENTSE